MLVLSVDRPRRIDRVTSGGYTRGGGQQAPPKESRYRRELFAGARRGLSVLQSDGEYNALLNASFQSIYEASNT
jgi:hypothetical protein